MVRNYVRTSTRGCWSQEALLKAIEAVESKTMSIRKAGNVFGIPEATIRRKMKMGVQEGKTRWRTIRDSYKKTKNRMEAECVQRSSKSKYNSDHLNFLDNCFTERSGHSSKYVEPTIKRNKGDFPDGSNSQDPGETNVGQTTVRIKQEKLDDNEEKNGDTGEPSPDCAMEYLIPSSLCEVAADLEPQGVPVVEKPRIRDPVPEETYEPTLRLHGQPMGYAGHLPLRVGEMRAKSFRCRPRRQRRDGDAGTSKIALAPIAYGQVEHPIYSFFRSMAATVVSFPPQLIAETRLKVCQLITELELRMLTQDSAVPSAPEVTVYEPDSVVSQPMDSTDISQNLGIHGS